MTRGASNPESKPEVIVAEVVGESEITARMLRGQLPLLRAIRLIDTYKSSSKRDSSVIPDMHMHARIAQEGTPTANVNASIFTMPNPLLSADWPKYPR